MSEPTATVPAQVPQTDWKNLAALRYTVLSTQATPERIHDLYSMIAAAKAFLKELDALVDSSALEYIEEYGPFDIGDNRYVAIQTKTVKCNNVPAAAEKLMGVLGGKLFLGCLASGAFKPGTVKDLLKKVNPPLFHELFSTTYSDAVKVIKLNKNFLPK